MTKFLTRFKEEQEGGFTLIELLVVILIIGILSAIAIPTFLNQRKGAVDAAVKADITNAGTFLTTEAMEGRTLSETTSINQNGIVTETSSFMMRASVATGIGTINTSEIKVSEGTTLILQPSTVEGAVCIFAVNPSGNISAKSPGFVYDSQSGGLLRDESNPVACATESGSNELNVPTAAIKTALAKESGTPEAGAPQEDPAVEVPAGTPSESGPVSGGEDEGSSSGITVISTYKGTLFDNMAKCYVPNSDYTMTLFIDEADYLVYTITGLDSVGINHDEESAITFKNDEDGKRLNGFGYGDTEGGFDNPGTYKRTASISFMPDQSSIRLSGIEDSVNFAPSARNASVSKGTLCD